MESTPVPSQEIVDQAAQRLVEFSVIGGRPKKNAKRIKRTLQISMRAVRDSRRKRIK